METHVKPIQATPTLSKTDTKSILKEVLNVPSTEAIERNKKLLAIRKSIQQR